MVYRRQREGWTQDVRLRGLYEWDARSAYQDLRYRRVQRKAGPVDVYSVTLPVPGYDNRQVTVEVDRRYPSHPRVYADGPTDSPHRFADRDRHRLCIWLGGDTPDRKWIPEDGLLVLLAMTSEHLFKEAWWRDHDEWLGDEAPHDPMLPWKTEPKETGGGDA